MGFKCPSEQGLPNYEKLLLLLFVIIIIIIITYLFTVDKKVLHSFRQKNGKIMYLYKSVNIIF